MLDKHGETKDDLNVINNMLTQLLHNRKLETQRQKAYQSQVDQLEYQINFEDRKMGDIKDEMAMLDSDDVDEKLVLKKMERLQRRETEAVCDMEGHNKVGK